MINLARQVDRDNPKVDSEVQEIVRKELTEAGIEVVDFPVFINSCGEVPTSIVGSFAGWIFKRLWYYYSASGPGIPSDIAEEFNNKWGKIVRVGGMAGGISPLRYYEGFAVGDYHIDTQEGLNAFVELLKTIHKPREKT
jgi:hypothetical protein